jgi:hypothetical protein
VFAFSLALGLAFGSLRIYHGQSVYHSWASSADVLQNSYKSDSRADRWHEQAGKSSQPNIMRHIETVLVTRRASDRLL